MYEEKNEHKRKTICDCTIFANCNYSGYNGCAFLLKKAKG